MHSCFGSLCLSVYAANELVGFGSVLMSFKVSVNLGSWSLLEYSISSLLDYFLLRSLHCDLGLSWSDFGFKSVIFTFQVTF